MAITVIYTNANGDSIEFSETSGIRITRMDGIDANNIEISENTVSQQVGASMSGMQVKPKDITIEGVYSKNGRNRVDVATTRRTLLDVIMPGFEAKLRYINTESGDDVYWEGAPTQTPIISLNPNLQKFQFVFHCPYPYPRGTKQNITEFNTMVSGFMFPQTYTRPFKISTKNYHPLQTIMNRGSISTGFIAVFEADADVKSPRVINVQTQEIISFKGLQMHQGDRIEVCTIPNQKYARFSNADGVSNIFDKMEFISTFFQLQKGENSIKYEADSGAANLRFEIMFENTTAGV